MSDLDTRFHETWLGMVQPIEGLVVSLPVLVDAQCMNRQPPTTQALLHELAPIVSHAKDGSERRRIRDFRRMLAELLELTPDLFDADDGLPDDLSLYIPEGQQKIRPTLGLRKIHADGARDDAETSALPDDSTPASRNGTAYEMLAWELPEGLPLDAAETTTGSWHYPPSAKFDRLLRACRVPIGVLTNRDVVRLVYAPHGESSGAITFRVDDMATVGGRPILDAFIMLLSATRFFGVAKEYQLGQILRDSRTRQANVTNALATQVFEALGILLEGFEAAAERDGGHLLDDALARGADHLYGGLLTVLLRLVFLLYAEDRDLLPMGDEHYAEHMSVLGLFQQLQSDAGSFPDSMPRRYGAWSRLLAVSRAVFFGVRRGSLQMPARRGQLFNPESYPFLEGWGPAGGAPVEAGARAGIRVPTVDDGTIYRVLEKLLLLEGQRLSYRALDVEQIGSVYEALMGYHVLRVPSPAVCLKPEKVWVAASDVLEQPRGRRAAFLEEAAALPKSVLTKIAAPLQAAKSETDIATALEGQRVKGLPQANIGRLVIQPGTERRRTSSHYTPRSLSAPIVARTLEPLLLAMGNEPPSKRLLNLKVCDPAMGSGAFLVEACRFLGDQVIAAWTREGQIDKVASAHEDVVNHARRLVAQRCLYGVDKNQFAVNLAKLSLWLVTLARDEPFTFVDHALRHGDSLVGLDYAQIRDFHWRSDAQQELCRKELEAALEEAIRLRHRILALAVDAGSDKTQEKERLLDQADDTLERPRMLGDLVVGAFFAHEKDKDRRADRQQRLDAASAWLRGDGTAPQELREMQREIRERVPVFHWMLEFPEVFFAERPDPLDDDQVNRAAMIDAFVGNPPFLGQGLLSGTLGEAYRDWLFMTHPGAQGKSDLVAHFFRRTANLLGAHGTIGLIATNTIAQGDTRESGLKPLVGDGLVIYDATRSMKWPGDANVAVSVVHIAKGNVARVWQHRRLNGMLVDAINSRLRSKPERPDPTVLHANDELSFKGCEIGGQGFTLTQGACDALVARDKRNRSRIFLYVGGEDVNTSPVQTSQRFVIDFAQMSLDEAQRWPDLIAILQSEVKPDREQGNRASRKRYWWRFAEVQPALRAAIAPLERCLVTARVTKHLCFSFQPTSRVLSEQLFVFALDRFEQFAVLQSRSHEPWARLLSSSMRNDLRYSGSECFETFPFPAPDPGAVLPVLAAIGESLYAARASFMVDTRQGLTVTYNLLKDPECSEPRILELRRLHEEMDRAVLGAYGWDDIYVPSYSKPTTDVEKRALEAFEDEVIDRLFALNAQRAEEERLLGANAGEPAKGRKAKGKTKAPPMAQLGLIPEDDD